ncbi:MAG: hypothetical protein JW806_07050 [Sedimentisphaerales bacterium]|nr:hypothetical protein [Sedimentisphaerales bacterium]
MKITTNICLVVMLVFSSGCQREYFRTAIGPEVISMQEKIVEISVCSSKGREAFKEKPIGLKEIAKTDSPKEIKDIMAALEKAEITKHTWDIPDGYHLTFKINGEDGCNKYIYTLCLDMNLDYERKTVYSHFIYDETGVLFDALKKANLVQPLRKMSPKDYPVRYK